MLPTRQPLSLWAPSVRWPAHLSPSCRTCPASPGGRWPGLCYALVWVTGQGPAKATPASCPEGSPGTPGGTSPAAFRKEAAPASRHSPLEPGVLWTWLVLPRNKARQAPALTFHEDPSIKANFPEDCDLGTWPTAQRASAGSASGRPTASSSSPLLSAQGPTESSARRKSKLRTSPLGSASLHRSKSAAQKYTKDETHTTSFKKCQRFKILFQVCGPRHGESVVATTRCTAMSSDTISPSGACAHHMALLPGSACPGPTFPANRPRVPAMLQVEGGAPGHRLPSPTSYQLPRMQGSVRIYLGSLGAGMRVPASFCWVWLMDPRDVGPT